MTHGVESAGTVLARPEPGRAWVYLTFGTVFGNATLLRAAAAALARLPVDVLVASGSVAPGELADLRRDRSWTVSGPSTLNLSRCIAGGHQGAQSSANQDEHNAIPPRTVLK